MLLILKQLDIFKSNSHFKVGFKGLLQYYKLT